MSDLLMGTIVVCLTLVFVVAIVCWTRYVTTKDREIERLLREDGKKLDRNLETLLPPRTNVQTLPPMEAGAEPQATQPDLSTVKPLAVDPERPPKKGFYKPRPGSPHPAPKCVCHGEPVRPDQAVIWWPVQDSEEVRLFCVKEGT